MKKYEVKNSWHRPFDSVLIKEARADIWFIMTHAKMLLRFFRYFCHLKVVGNEN
jgi:hypothetical protein